MENNKSFGGIYTIVAFVLGSVMIPLISQISDNHFKTKQANIDELNFNSKYVENIVANVGNLDQKIELAKYYATVTTDKKIRQSWLRYYKLLENDRAILDDTINVLYDSLIKINDSSQLINNKYFDAYKYFKNLKNLNSETNINPYTKKETKSNISFTKRVYIQYSKNDLSAKIKDKLLSLDWIVPQSEKMDFSIFKNEIRYFNDGDITLANELKLILDKEKEIYEIKKIDLKSPNGQLEIWTKE